VYFAREAREAFFERRRSLLATRSFQFGETLVVLLSEQETRPRGRLVDPGREVGETVVGRFEAVFEVGLVGGDLDTVLPTARKGL
jgi:hypothetical protein